MTASELWVLLDVSTDSTTTLYSVPALRSVSVYSVAVTRLSFIFASSTYILYPATSTLSVDAVHVIFALVSVISDASTLVGASGAVVSTVSTVAASDFCVLFDVSTASTTTLYSVPALRSVSIYSVAVTRLSFTFAPSTYILYPATSTLSVDAVHVIFTLVSVTSDAVTLVGALGPSSSGASNVVNVSSLDSALFPASSTASTFTLYSVSASRPVSSYFSSFTVSPFTFLSFR